MLDNVRISVSSIKVQAYRERAICPKCNGEMKATGYRHLLRGMNPPNAQHECDNCGNIDWLAESYPRIVHKEID